MRLDRFANPEYDPGGTRVTRLAWYIVNALVFSSWLLPVSAPKRGLLRLFGARIGAGVVIKPRVNIKYPWRVDIGDHTWIGEGVWLDTVGNIEIGSHACVSQGAYFVTGNHDYRADAFDLMVGDIRVGDRAWVGARSIVGPGVELAPGSVVTAGSVVLKSTEPDTVYQGNPAVAVRSRYRPVADDVREAS